MSSQLANKLINLSKEERDYCIKYLSPYTFTRWSKATNFREKIRLHMGGEPLSWWAKTIEGSKDKI